MHNQNHNFLNFGIYNIDNYVIEAIKNASSVTNISFETLMIIVAIESDFKPNASAKTSSAKGLFQITEKTWKSLQERFPNDHLKNIFDPYENALAGALLIKENNLAMERNLKRTLTISETYALHFLGFSAFLKLFNNKNIFANELLPKAANANLRIFYKNNIPRTSKEIFEYFENLIRNEQKNLNFSD